MIAEADSKPKEYSRQSRRQVNWIFAGPLLAMLSFSLLVLLVTRSYERELLDERSANAKSIIGGLAGEVGTAIGELRRQLQLFGARQAELIAALADEPDNELVYQQLYSRIMAHFPDATGFALARADGEPISTGTLAPVGESCQKIFHAFAREGTQQQIGLHANAAGQPHIPVLAPWHSSEGHDGVLLLSLPADFITRQIRHHRFPGLALYLTNADGSLALDEDGAHPSRQTPPGSSPMPTARVEASLPVAGTKWHATAFLDTGSAERLHRRIWEHSALILLAFWGLGLGLMTQLVRNNATRQRARDNAWESASRLDQTLHAAGAGYWHWQPHSASMQLNVNHLGLGLPNADKLSGEQWMERIEPHDRGPLSEHWDTLRKGEQSQSEIRYRVRGESGETLWIEDCGTIIQRDHRGQPAYVTGSLLNIDERERIRDQLREERRRTEATLSAIADAVVCLDADERVAYLNPAAERLCGWTQADATGRKMQEVCPRLEPGSAAPLPVLTGSESKPARRNALLIGRDGSHIGIEEHCIPILDRHGQYRELLLVFRETAGDGSGPAAALRSAGHDELTGLVNRSELERRLRLALANCRESGTETALCFMDIDHFTAVNETAGYRVGDKLLNRLATRMAQRVRGRDTLARLEADRFCLLLESCPPDKATEIAEGIRQTVQDFEFRWRHESLCVTVSAGLVPTICLGKEPETLLDVAELACQDAKQHGGNRIRIADKPVPGIDSARLSRHGNRLARALESDDLALHAHPVFRLGNGTYPSADIALLQVGPKDLPQKTEEIRSLARRGGLDSALDRWVIKHGISTCRAKASRCLLSVSPRSLAQRDLQRFVRERRRSEGVEAEQIIFSLSLECGNQLTQETLEAVRQLHTMGYGFAVGGGWTRDWSAVMNVSGLPADYFLIDQDLTFHLAESELLTPFLRAACAVAHERGGSVIAGPVADQDTLERLQALQVDLGYGPALSEPWVLVGGDDKLLGKIWEPAS
ncbi:MAG: diguanylate cyclase [Chromatiales bacterium]|nr:diguanylate cyclase [Chromatiales bacterium]